MIIQRASSFRSRHASYCGSQFLLASVYSCSACLNASGQKVAGSVLFGWRATMERPKGGLMIKDGPQGLRGDGCATLGS